MEPTSVAHFDLNTAPHPSDSWLAGAAALLQHRWYDAHEHFEQVWRVADDWRRDFVQSIIHGAAALELCNKGRIPEARKQLQKMERRLELAQQDAWQGIYAKEWMRELHRVVEAPSISPSPPRLDDRLRQAALPLGSD